MRLISFGPSVLRPFQPSHLTLRTRQLHCIPTNFVQKNLGDVHTYKQGHAAASEHVASGFEAKSDSRGKGPSDAATARQALGGPKGERDSGHSEGIGFGEQVGGQSGSAKKMHVTWGCDIGESKGPRDDSIPPGLLQGLKKMLGGNISAEEVRQSRGEGRGVTRMGTFTSKSDRRRHMSTLSRVSSEGPNKEVEGRHAGASERQHTQYQASADAETGSDGHIPDDEKHTPQWQMKKRGTDANAEFPTGPFRNAGVPGDEQGDYGHVSKEDPYEPPGAEPDEKLRYGNVKRKLNPVLDDGGEKGS